MEKRRYQVRLENAYGIAPVKLCATGAFHLPFVFHRLHIETDDVVHPDCTADVLLNQFFASSGIFIHV